MVKNPPANAGNARDAGLIPGSGRFPGVGNGNLFEYSYLVNPMDRGAWQATVHGVTKSQTGQSNRAMHCTALRFSDTPEVTNLIKMKPGFKLIIKASVLALNHMVFHLSYKVLK